MSAEQVNPIPKSRGDLFKRVHAMIRDENLKIDLNRRSPELEKIVGKCLGHILEQEELNEEALKYVSNFCKKAPYHYGQSKSQILHMFRQRKSYFDAMIPIQTMMVEDDTPPVINKVVLENDISSTITDVTMENDVTSAMVEFTIPSMQKKVLPQTPPVAAHVTVDVPMETDPMDTAADDELQLAKEREQSGTQELWERLVANDAQGVK